METNDIWIDLTHKIGSDTLPYFGDPSLIIEFLEKDEQSGFSISKITTGMHLGTHVDSPMHFIGKGKSISDIPLEKWMGFASKINVFPAMGIISTNEIESKWNLLSTHHQVLLINSGHDVLFGKREFYDKCPAFEPSFFIFLQKNSIRLVGLDLPTIKYPGNNNKAAHRDLLGRDILIVESLANLASFPNELFFMALPLNISGLEASMVRAVGKKLDTN